MDENLFQKIKEKGYAFAHIQLLHNMSATRTIALGFCLIILTGTLLLMLPIATREGQETHFLDALFTAASATCVTGLVRYDTYTHWTFFGQIIILLMIQIGGIGFMTITLSFVMLAKRRIGLNQRILMQETVAAPQVGGIVKMTRLIIYGTLFLEGLGAALLAFHFCPKFGFWQGIYFGIFHAISAFCNAGFDLMGIVEPGSSLISEAGNPYVNFIIIALIVLGGLGFFVWYDLLQARFHFRETKLHTKVVLCVTFLLIISGAALIFLFELEGTLYKDKAWGERILCSLFQSVTPRTAGFNTVPLNQLTSRSQVIMIFLMLIGGSPGSTAGGMKTTTMAVLVCSVYTTFRRKKSIELFHRRVDDDILRTAVTVAVFYIGLSFCAALAISAIDQTSFMAAIFETVSAIATVGSSLGITGNLSEISAVILTFLMIVGRIGSVTFLLAFSSGAGAPKSQYPIEKIPVG